MPELNDHPETTGDQFKQARELQDSLGKGRVEEAFAKMHDQGARSTPPDIITEVPSFPDSPEAGTGMGFDEPAQPFQYDRDPALDHRRPIRVVRDAQGPAPQAPAPEFPARGETREISRADLAEIESNRKHRDKMTVALARGLESGHLGDAGDVLVSQGVEVTDAERGAVTKAIQKGRITDQTLDTLISTIARPLDEPQQDGQVFRQLADSTGDPNRRRMRLVRQVFQGDQDLANDTMTREAMGAFAERYPTPLAVLPALKAAEAQLAGGRPGKDEKYATAGEDVMRIMYGKQYDYWQEAQRMKDEALFEAETRPSGGLFSRLRRKR